MPNKTMRTIISIAVLTFLFLAAPGVCFAMSVLVPVSKEGAKEMGIEVRSEAAGPNDVRVEVQFTTEGKMKNFAGVDLRISEGQKELVNAPLRVDRSKPGRVVVSFSANRGQLDKINLWVHVPAGPPAQIGGGTILELRVKDFVELKKGR